ncbi:hypothetical protein C0Q70_07735 [Pomacea canaliculata]|uniref:Uncharacterized protein n=2 Tax=Pomacea canaliculata TaxID=400727 RepID=A0A2T7PFW3_POMCA|nr:hypothetical protein C0Q70_07735 [Pomacea canaliculata]
MPAVQPIKPSLLTSEGQDKVTQGEDDDDQYLQKALEESRQLVEQDDMALQKALNDSMTGYIDESLKQGLFEEMSPPAAHSSSQKTCPTEELRQKRLAFLEKQSSSSSSQAESSTVTKKDSVLDDGLKGTGDEGSDDEMLKQALKMSMEQP